MSVLDTFHPALRTWFQRRFGAPSKAQELGWPTIAEAQLPPGHDVLLCAPTGSGKTLAAFMWAINQLVLDAEQSALRDQVSVLYVSPLKALANDIRLNLEEPLAGIRQTARESGLDLVPIRAGLRTGDTPVGERAAMLRRPPHILVTTPESLFIMITSPRFREKLRGVRYVIVDELHAVAGNKRGPHLMLSLERLERMVRAAGAPRPARIGLSATLNPIETLAAFLAGAEVHPDDSRHPRPVRIVRADDGPRQLDLAVIAPGPELGSLATHQHWEAMYDALGSLIRDHRTTLVFTLSRRWAERIALALQKRVGADAVMAHHGSLARAERLDAEQRLKRGELKAIVATASLELGIDVGAVDLVCQIDSPKSISAAIQRIGRSGHSLGATPKGRFFALTLDDLIECAAAVRAIRLGHLDEVELPVGCLDVAAQQIVAIATDEEDISESDLLRVLRSTENFADFDFDSLRPLLTEMAAQLPERIQGANPKIFYDRVSGRVRPRRSARLSAITSGGTIPESGNLDVVIASEGRKIGDVEEDFAQESSRGDIFSLGSMPWRVLGISKNRFMVEPAPGMAPSLPFWQVEAGGRSAAMSSEICDVRKRIAARLTSPAVRADSQFGEGKERNTLRNGTAESPPVDQVAAEWLMGECALDRSAAIQAVAYVRRGVAALGAVPDERNLVVERFFDGLGGTQIVIHSPLGMRLNRGLGLALRKKLCQSFDFEIQASAIDDAVLLALNSRHSFSLDNILTMVTARTIRDTLVQALLDAPMFEVRFRHVATRALSVMRSMRGRKVPAWIQRLRTQELVTALFPQRNACFENRPPAIEVPQHFIVREAVSESLHETADLPRLEKLLAGLESGSVRARFVDNVAPSVFAHRVLLAWDYSFLDDGERANRRSRTVSMNRAMAEDVFRSEDLAEVLSSEAIDIVAAEIDGRAASSRARNPDELCELIRNHGSLPSANLQEHTVGDSATLLATLTAGRRVLSFRPVPDGPELLICAEDAPTYAVAYPASGIPADDLPDAESARREIVRRALATLPPVRADQLASRVFLSHNDVERALASLEAAGAVFRGHFTPSISSATDSAASTDAPLQNDEQWCDRYVLERVHRQTLGRLRAEVEPCTDLEFVAFRLKWQGLSDADSHNGLDGVRAVLQQMSGLAYSPEFWERAILPSRVPNYRPEYLDLLCMSGEFSWVATAFEDDALGATGDFPSGVAFLPRHARFSPRSLPLPDEPRTRAVHAALAASGAEHLDRVADRAGLSERDTLTALWRLAAAGLVSNDSFAPLRLIATERDASGVINERGNHRPLTRHDAALRARLKSSLSGRWSLVESAGTNDSPKTLVNEVYAPEHAREIADLLLRRHGVLTREMLALEQFETSWQELSSALRRMEYAGLIRRGWFVRPLSGEQYALPEAVEMLRALRASTDSLDNLTALSAADPANPYGVLLPGCGIPRDAANLVVIRGGAVVMGLAGRALVTPSANDDDGFTAALTALMKFRTQLAVETINGLPALESNCVGLMAAMGFHSDGRSLVYDGLPGPLPARAATLRRADQARPF